MTHDIPDGPVILTPEEGAFVDPDDAVISWDPVTEPAGIEIAGYRVTVERGDRGRSLSLELPPETTSVLVPPDFLEPGTDYLFQVFAIEVGGNQTISQGVFDTAEGGLGAEPEACGDETSKCVFLSSTNQNGNLGGLTGADQDMPESGGRGRLLGGARHLQGMAVDCSCVGGGASHPRHGSVQAGRRHDDRQQLG